MKALKEKRVSLRSALRRSLVILSLFALVFAGCSSSDDDNSNGGGYNGGGGGSTGPKAEIINVLIYPSGPSYQGRAPNLSGAVLEVFWSDGTRTRVEGDLAGQGFYALPGYCDEPGVGAAAGYFNIAYGGSSVLSAPFTLPGVIWCQQLDLTSRGNVTWYSDQRPDYTMFDLEGTYQYHIDDPYANYSGNTSTGPTPAASLPIPPPGTLPHPKMKTEKLKIDMSMAYPPIDVTRTADELLVQVKVGYLKSTVSGSTTTFLGENQVQSRNMQISKYLEVEGIEIVEGTNWPVVFDDSLEYALGTRPEQAANIYALLQKAQPSFKIYYVGGESRVIDWVDFVGNVTYSWNMMNKVSTSSALDPTNIFVSNGGVRVDTRDSSGALYELDWDEDNDSTWPIILEYVPKDFGNSAYISKFPVDIPIYEFQDDVVIEKREGSAPNNVWIQEAASATEPNPDQIDAINLKWVMKPQYARAGVPAEREVPFYSQTYPAAMVTSPPRPILFSDWGTLLASQNLGATYGTSMNTGDYVFSRGDDNIGLPAQVYYRGQTYSDETETVLVDIFYRK